MNQRDSDIRVMDLPSGWEHADPAPDMFGPEDERGRVQLMMQLAAAGQLPAVAASQQFTIDFERDREEKHRATATTPVPTAKLYLVGTEALLREASSMLLEIEGSEARGCATLTHKARSKLIECSGENPPKRVGAARKRVRRVLEEVPVGTSATKKVRACLEAANYELWGFAQNTHFTVDEAIEVLAGRIGAPDSDTKLLAQDLGMAIEEFVEEGG